MTSATPVAVQERPVPVLAAVAPAGSVQRALPLPGLGPRIGHVAGVASEADLGLRLERGVPADQAVLGAKSHPDHVVVDVDIGHPVGPKAADTAVGVNQLHRVGAGDDRVPGDLQLVPVGVVGHSGDTSSGYRQAVVPAHSPSSRPRQAGEWGRGLRVVAGGRLGAGGRSGAYPLLQPVTTSTIAAAGTNRPSPTRMRRMPCSSLPSSSSGFRE